MAEPRSKAKSGHQARNKQVAKAAKQDRKRKQVSKFKNAELRAALDSQASTLYLVSLDFSKLVAGGILITTISPRYRGRSKCRKMTTGSWGFSNASPI